MEQRTSLVRVTGVTISRVELGPIAEEIAMVGVVRSRAIASVAARLQGTVATVLVRPGDRVHRGDRLLVIAAAESEAAAAAAAAAVEAARQTLEEANVRRRLAETTHTRYVKLLQAQAVTRQEFDTRESERDLAVRGVSRAEAVLAQARESARSAAILAGHSLVVAPIGGVVTARSVDAGATVFPGMALFNIEAEGESRLEVSAPESLLGRIRLGDRLPLELSGAADSTVGRVVEVVPLVDPASRTFLVKVQLAGSGHRTGSYGRALFPLGARRGIQVPRQALVQQGSLTWVWVVEQGGVARMRLIRVGASRGDRLEVLSGLSTGDRIVSAGADRVTDGAKVE